MNDLTRYRILLMGCFIAFLIVIVDFATSPLKQGLTLEDSLNLGRYILVLMLFYIGMMNVFFPCYAKMVDKQRKDNGDAYELSKQELFDLKVQVESLEYQIEQLQNEKRY